MVNFVAACLLWRHVASRAECGTFSGNENAPLYLRKSKVHDLDLSCFRKHDVTAFYVAVHDAFLVCRLQSARNLFYDSK